MLWEADVEVDLDGLHGAENLDEVLESLAGEEDVEVDV